MTLEDRITALEARLASAEARIALLESERRSCPTPTFPVIPPNPFYYRPHEVTCGVTAKAEGRAE